MTYAQPPITKPGISTAPTTPLVSKYLFRRINVPFFATVHVKVLVLVLSHIIPVALDEFGQRLGVH